MDKKRFKKIAEDVEVEWGCGGLSDGLYYDYAFEIAKRYIKACHLTSSSSRAAYDCGKSGHIYYWKDGICIYCGASKPPPA